MFRFFVKTCSILPLAMACLIGPGVLYSAGAAPSGTGGPWAVDQLTPALRQHADAVRRMRRIVYRVESPTDIRLEVTEVITVLNDRGSDHAGVVVYYDPFIKVRDLSAVLYDADGNRVRKYKENDFTDIALQDGFSLYHDNRAKYLEPAISRLPATVEYSYTLQLKGLLGFRPWNLFPDYRFAVEKDELVVSVPKSYAIRIKNQQWDIAPEKTETAGLVTYRWQTGHHAALQAEAFSPPLSARTPAVLVAPDRVEFDGSSGHVADWKSLGLWAYGLQKDRARLPAATIEQVRRLTAGASSVSDKVCQVYRFMQSRTRYVSIQLGIGGLQPFAAEEVDRTGYGDCKALSNYTQALLQAAGVPSHYAVVGAGDWGDDIRFPDFASLDQGNHVILCVPRPAAEGDTLWLECTDQRQPCGYLGRFTGNRSALLVTPQGGVLARTTHYGPEQNRYERQLSLRLREDGSVSGTTEIAGIGLAYEKFEPLERLSGVEREKWLAEAFPVADARLTGFNAHALSGALPAIRWSAKLAVSRLAAPQGNRLLVQLVPFRTQEVPSASVTRQSPVFLPYGRLENDTVRWELPPGFAVEFLPAAQDLETPFGQYQRRVEQQGHTLVMTRRLRLSDGRWPAESWPEFSRFLRQVAAADAEKGVLIKT